ncbi:response regulator [Shimia sagamensis]|uniref:Response regulator receiver domain-containing protein n=1 Tax=Shimia sagamensis TaxID=1566352 RepID=A0ABY1NQE1_9RHOB|nr:response regulator [Shimia sagamensis]SMP14543.1 Response regulator receiver domain-containing protein [Shimia sagamensis]
MKILAVDDDEHICELLSEAVAAKTDHTIVTVASGPEAIRAIAKAKIPFDCFILDVQMPIMDGITLAKKIRKTKPYTRTPILMLTAMSQKKYVDAAFEAGATDYVTKPFDFLELFTRISIAERQIADHKELISTVSEMASLKKELIFNTDHSLSEPIELTGVTQLVGCMAFDAHVLAMPRRQRMRTRAFGIKISTIENAYKTLSAVAFRHMLTDIGSELLSVMAHTDTQVTYKGDGVFVGTLPRSAGYSAPRLEAELNSRLDYVPSTQVDGLDNEVCFGEAVALRTLTSGGALYALQKAVTNVHTRAQAPRRSGTDLRKTIRLHPASGFQTEQERRAYESLLHDALHEGCQTPQSAATFG